MSQSTLSPSRRGRMSLAERNSNLDMVTMLITNGAIQPKKKAAFSRASIATTSAADLSPASRARTLRPRKSILKALPRQDNDDTYMGQQQNHTISFAPSSSSAEESQIALRNESTADRRRGRVSFAANMHVRYLEVRGSGGPSPSRVQRLPAPNPRRRTFNGSHNRRHSIQSVGDLSTATTLVNGGNQSTATARTDTTLVGSTHRNVGQMDVSGGEMSMELDTASEASSDEDDESGDELSGVGGARISLIQEEEIDDEEEEDMDETQVYGIGIQRRESIPASEDMSMDMSIASSTNPDEEKTMDFTLAIGGVLPNSPPPTASRGRQSIGYSLPASPNSDANRLRPGQAMDGETDMSMDETIAIGGIINIAGGDDTMSSNGSNENITMANRERTMTFSFTPSALIPTENDDDGMDMTIAVGGIIDYPVISPARPVFPKSPLPGNKRLSSGNTPSFARPTASSAQKAKPTEKRNVFAPSPSPTKENGEATPRRGMAAAGDVAKRLSFGSTTSSGGGGRKRIRDDPSESDKEGDISAKRPKGLSSSVSGNVFATTTTNTTPRKALSTRKSLPALNQIGKSPAKSPMLRRVLGLPVNEDQDDQNRSAEWEPSTIALATFLEMAGVQFMENLPGMNRRRSSVARGLLGNSVYGSTDREFGLEDYTSAQLDSMFLNMYSWACNKLKTDIKECQKQCQETEEICDLHNPPVIREYLSATDEDKDLFEMTFKSYKTHTQLMARSKWYDWKLDLMQRVRPDVEAVLERVQEDKERVDTLYDDSVAILPELEARYAALQEELAADRAIVEEIEACSQEELEGLREMVDEGSNQVAVYHSDLAETTSRLEKLESNLAELQSKKADALGAIQVARSKCDQYTKSDIYRLQEEYQSIQALHLWRPSRISPDQMILIYDGEIRLSLECNDSVANLSTAQVELLTPEEGDRAGRAKGVVEKNGPTEGLFSVMKCAVEEVVESKHFRSAPALIQHIGQLWTACQRIRSEFRYAAMIHPVAYSTFQGEGEQGTVLLARTSIMYPSKRSKVVIEFGVSSDILRHWPRSCAGIDVDVKTIYGDVGAEELKQIAKETIKLASDEGCLGAILQTCSDVAAQY